MYEEVRVLINSYGSGPALAIKYAIDNTSSKSVCVAMGDGSDDPKQVEDLFLLIERGLSVAVASRYIKNGNYIGKKGIKYLLSKYSGFFLYFVFRIGTKDPTNMFKAYSKDFINSVKIDSNYIVCRAFRKLSYILNISRENCIKKHKIIIMKGRNAQREINSTSKMKNYKYRLENSITDNDSKIIILNME